MGVEDEGIVGEEQALSPQVTNSAGGGGYNKLC